MAEDQPNVPDSGESEGPPATRPKRKAKAKPKRQYPTPAEFAFQLMDSGIQRSGPGFFSDGTQHSYRVNMKKGYMLCLELIDELYDALEERDAAGD